MDFLVIGSSPSHEDCVQVGNGQDNEMEQKFECNAFLEAVRRKIGPEPLGASLRVKSNPHDFEAYYEVVCVFGDEEGADYAYKCESNCPNTWEEVGMRAPVIGSSRTGYAIRQSPQNSPLPHTYGLWKDGKVVDESKPKSAGFTPEIEGDTNDE